MQIKPSTRDAEFLRIRVDTLVGMAVSNIIGIAIIITTAATLHAHGKTNVETSAQAAEALRPLAGVLAEFIFALGIIGEYLGRMHFRLLDRPSYAVRSTDGFHTQSAAAGATVSQEGRSL